MTSEATNPTWPPPSLATINVVALVNDCEEAEMSVATSNRPFAAVRIFCVFLVVVHDVFFIFTHTFFLFIYFLVGSFDCTLVYW